MQPQIAETTGREMVDAADTKTSARFYASIVYRPRSYRAINCFPLGGLTVLAEKRLARAMGSTPPPWHKLNLRARSKVAGIFFYHFIALLRDNTRSFLRENSARRETRRTRAERAGRIAREARARGSYLRSLRNSAGPTRLSHST